MSLSNIGFEKNWLAKAAVAEANHKKLLTFPGLKVQRQLVLARYSNSLLTTPFIYSQVRDKGAMWTDFLTDLADETHLIAGFKFEGKCEGIQALRVGLPSDYPMSSRDPRQPICGAFVESTLVREYWIRSDISNMHFANIPVDWCSDTRMFVQPSGYVIPSTPAIPPLPPFSVSMGL